MLDAAPSFEPEQLRAALATPRRAITPQQRLTELAGRLSTTLALARALIQGGRQLDLKGIDDGIGMLCAQTLDLPQGEAVSMVLPLRDVLAQVDLLSAALRGTRPDQAWPC